MHMYKDGRLFCILCSVAAFVQGLLAGITTCYLSISYLEFGGVVALLLGLAVGLLAALPLLVLSELVDAVFDIAENSHKLVALGKESQQKQPDTGRQPE